MAESRDASDAQNDMSTSQQEPTRLAKAVVPSVIHDRFRGSSSVAYQALSVHGYSRPTDYQKTFASLPISYLDPAISWIRHLPEARADIIVDLEGILLPGDMLLVLGKPGSGCTTFLKTLAGQTNGVCVDERSSINFHGLAPNVMHNKLRGKCIYQAEMDVHFPTLSVRETLEFAMRARNSKPSASPENDRVGGISRGLGLSNVLDTKIGNDLVRGVSGGERKRASIGEILVGDSIIQCWDNSTRGLDSANALQFVKLLRQQITDTRSIAVVTLYQVSDEIFKLFDKVTVLYQGQQIYFGPTQDAKSYFTNLGFVCPKWATIPEFLVSVTTPAERVSVSNPSCPNPTDALTFAAAWRSSPARKALIQQIQDYNKYFQKMPPVTLEHGGHLPYSISMPSQVLLCVGRGLKRLRNDLATPVSALVGNCIISLILGSMFYNMSDNTDSFFGRGVLLFITVFLNSSLAAFECIAVWDVRPIIEKHFQYAFYHPVSEAIASVLVDLPNKILLTLFFNFPVYFLANLRRTPAAFFVFYLFALMSLMNGSMIYRAMGAMSRTSEGSQPPGAVFSLLLVLYSGFVVPFRNMRPWLQWFAYVNPVYYGFESLAINEFSQRNFRCSNYVPNGPAYDASLLSHRACAVIGATPGQDFVQGDAYIFEKWGFERHHMWRNFGIMIALMFLYASVYLLCSEYISLQPLRGEILLYRKSLIPGRKLVDDAEHQGSALRMAQSSPSSHGESRHDGNLGIIRNEAATFVWNELNYQIKIGKTTKDILFDVEGWVRPGTLTALMGASGAGKTTLLNVLADRITTGVVHGKKLVATRLQDIAFARKVGYAQQQDLHLNSTTVREALEFSALLRQPPQYTRAAKLAWVDRVIALLDMDNDGFATAVIGVPGEGLNVEQRKRLTIGVELAARPELLLFLDEPTSGLDSTSAMSIVRLLRRLADNGQAILCVVHQPSTPLLAHFDRLLMLSEGKMIYFGALGDNFKIVTTYFERHGAPKLPEGHNPAEWILELANKPIKRDEVETTWTDIWKHSSERSLVKSECEKLELELAGATPETSDEKRASRYATGLWNQIIVLTKRAFQHDWRSPAYIWSKFFTTFGVTFINGVTFWKSGNTPEDIQNQVFSLFLLTTLFGAHVQLIMKRFYESRTLFEIREQPSRTYSWVAFLVSNILVEVSTQTIVGVIAFVSWYFPIGLWRNALWQDELSERAGLTFLFIWSLMILFQTLSQMVMVLMPNVPTGINVANLLFMLSLIFSGVLASPEALPGFWIFMYRATPLTYYIAGIMSTGLSGLDIKCESHDIVYLPRIPTGDTCASYLSLYISRAGGTLLNPGASSDCQICPYSDAKALLAEYGMYFSRRWRDFGISVAYNGINVALIFLLYWATRARKTGSHQQS